MSEENKINQLDNGTDGTALTFDEILEDKVYQSEFDKRVSKALETAKEKWEAKAATAKATWEAEAETAKNTAIAEATAPLESKLIKAMAHTDLVKAKARDIEVVMPLIDFEKVTLTDAGLEGLTEQLATLKESKAYLFETEDPAPAKGKSGLNHGAGDDKGDEEKIKKIMGLPV